MINLLLLSCGTNACYHCAKTLKEKFIDDFYIIGADINEQYLTPSCNYLDSFYKVPYSSSPNYYETILEICKKEKVDYILPSFDSDQKLWNRCRECGNLRFCWSYSWNWNWWFICTCVYDACLLCE